MGRGWSQRDLLLTAGAIVITAALTWAAATISPFAALAVAAGLVVFVALGTERAGMLCMILAFGTAPMSRGLDSLTAGVGTPTDLMLVLAWVLLLPSLAGRKLNLPLPWTLALVLLACFALIGSAASSAAVSSLTSLVQWIFFLGGLPLLVAWWRPGRDKITALLWAYVAGQMFSTTVALFEGKDPVTVRYDGLAIHPNGFGLAGLVTVTALLYLWSHHTDQATRILIAVAGVVALTSIWLSGSRAALAVAIVLMIMLPLVERSTLSGVGVFCVGGFAAAALPLMARMSDPGSALGRLIGNGTATAADQERETALSDGIHRFFDSPLTGSGLVNVELIHNLYVETAVAAGVVGLISYVVILGTLALPLLGTHPERRLAWQAWAVIGIAAALPGLWDRTIWVPVSLAILPALGTLGPAAEEPESAEAALQGSPA